MSEVSIAHILIASCALVGCVKPAVVPPPVTKPKPIAAAPPPPEVEDPTPAPPPKAGPEHFANAMSVVERVMKHAHAATATASAFVIPEHYDSVGEAGLDDGSVFFAVNDDVMGKVDLTAGCGADVLQLPWRTAPVGRANTRVLFESQPQWWRLNGASIRIGATELVGVARKDDDCNVWGTLVSGPPRVDPAYKSPGASGLTVGVLANVFGTKTQLAVLPIGLTLGLDSDADGLSDDAEIAGGTDPLKPDTDDDGVLDAADLTLVPGINAPIQVVPTFEATCVYARWASDLLGTRTLRVRFTNGAQEDDCPSGDIVEEFVQARGPTGDLTRTERIRTDAAGVVRDDHVVRTIGTGRLVWDATTTTTSETGDGCSSTTEAIVARWTFSHPTKPPHTAAARRVRTESTCPVVTHVVRVGGEQ